MEFSELAACMLLLRFGSSRIGIKADMIAAASAAAAGAPPAAATGRQIVRVLITAKTYIKITLLAGMRDLVRIITLNPKL